MLKAGLIDEISHLTVPIADGGEGISSFFDIPGDPPAKAAATLRLLTHKTLQGGVIWARYRVVPKHNR
jgi:riboflavin biosynthesis pyrimidine reductase